MSFDDYTYTEAIALVVYRRLIGRPTTLAKLCDRLQCSEWTARRLLREVDAMLSGKTLVADSRRSCGQRAMAWRVARVLQALATGQRLTRREICALAGLRAAGISAFLDHLSRVTPLTYETVVVDGHPRQEWYLIEG